MVTKNGSQHPSGPQLWLCSLLAVTHPKFLTDFTQLPSLLCLENAWLRIRLDSKVKTNNVNWKPLWAEGRGLQALTARGSGLGPAPPTPPSVCSSSGVQPPQPQPQQRAHSRQLLFIFLISKEKIFPFFKKSV